MITEENINQAIGRITELVGRLDQDGHPSQRPLLIGIDGMAAAGKSTLGQKLSESLHALLIHTDDYYLQQHQRTEARFAQPGGNFDRERFFEQVLLPLKNQQPVIMQKFDCTAMALGPVTSVLPSDIVIVEGTYSLHPLLYPWYDLAVWVGIHPDRQKERLQRRETREKLALFLERWIPFETRYFQELEILRKADLIL